MCLRGPGVTNPEDGEKFLYFGKERNMKMGKFMKATLAIRTPAEVVSIAGGQPRQSGVLRGPTRKQAHINSMLLILLAGSLLLLPAVVYGTMTPTTAGPIWGIDDRNTSTLNPSPAVKVSTLFGGRCFWINTVMDTFKNSHPGWSYDWASQADMAKVEQGISILDYYAWVVTEPSVKAGNDVNYPPDPPLENSNDNKNDVGGAVFNLKYTKEDGAHEFSDLHWIQAYYGSALGGPVETGLDNGGAGVPFYDSPLGKGTAGQLPNGGGWFLDTPWTIEPETEPDPVAARQFQVVLADYAATDKNHPELGGQVTLYGGEWWGYTYTATDVPVPDPASLTLALLGLGTVGVLRRRIG
jgi:hypothetical protein